MNPTDTRVFRAALRRLEIAYGCPVDAARDPVYFAALEEFPITTVISAVDDLASHHRTATGRFPITHDVKDRCREFIRAAQARQHPMRTTCPEVTDDDTPPMTKAEFCARLDTLRKKLARARPPARRHSSLTPLAQIADSLTHPHAISTEGAYAPCQTRSSVGTVSTPTQGIPPIASDGAFTACTNDQDISLTARAREPGEDDLPLEETPVQPDGAEDDPDAV